MTTLRQAAQAVLERWDSPSWSWSEKSPTADLMAALRTALEQQAEPPPQRKPLTDALTQERERLIRIMGTFDLATGHADTFDELLDSLELELRDVLGHYRAAVKEHLTQEPVAMLERTPRLGILRVTYEDAVTELHEGLYPLYVKPQIEVGCAECGVNGGHALYCVVCAEKFVGEYKDSGVPAIETELAQVFPDTPAQRPWVDLTDNDWGWVADRKGTSLDTFDQGAAWAQQRLKERNK